MPLRPTHALLVVYAVLGGGCKETGENKTTAEGSAAEVGSPDQVPTAPPRIEPIALERFGEQPGFVAGGLVYAAVRAEQAQGFLQRLPLHPNLVRDLAEAGAELGVDLRVDDVRKRFAIKEGAVISMTLARPLSEAAPSLRSELASGGEWLDALSPPPPAAPSKVEIAAPPTAPSARPVPLPADDEAQAPRQQAAPMPRPEPPPIEALRPPEPSPAAKARAAAFKRKASSLGLHFRFHIPVSDTGVIPRELERRLSRRDRTRWEPLCRAVPGSRLCVGESDVVAILREAVGAVVVDLVLFATAGDQDAAGRIEAAREAVTAPAAQLDPLAGLRGHAAAYVDAAAIKDVAEVDALRGAIRSLQWTDPGDRGRTIARQLEQVEAVERQLQTTVLFDGVALEVASEGEATYAVARWVLREGQQATATKLFEPPAARAKVPTIDALCAGALACARARGVPLPSRLGQTLASGLYAEPPRAFEQALDRGDEFSALLVMAATWPNALAAATTWPAHEAGHGPEAALVKGVVDAVGRIEGFGGSVRSLSLGRGGVNADYAVYARATDAEIGLVRGLLSFTEMRMSETNLAGVDGKVEMLRLPDADIAAVLMVRTEAETFKVDGADRRSGWLAVVDGPDRLAWLLGLEQDAGTAPTAYVEFPDLWRLVTAEPRAERDLGFARSWLTGRSLRAAIEIHDGAPRIVARTARQ